MHDVYPEGLDVQNDTEVVSSAMARDVGLRRWGPRALFRASGPLVQCAAPAREPPWERVPDDEEIELLSILLSIATVGVALGAIVIGSNANLRTELESLRADTRADVQGLRTDMETLRAETRSEVQELRTEMRAEIRSLRKDVRADLRAVEGRLAALEQRQARTEGLLEGLRDAIAAQRPPVPRGEEEAT